MGTPPSAPHPNRTLNDVAQHNPVDETERQAIIELIRSGLSRNQVAKQSGRSTSTITRIGESIGWDWLAAVDERTQSSLTRAHEARSAFSAERRATIAAQATQRAEQMLAKFEGEYLVFNFGGKENTYEEHLLDAPPVEAMRAMAATFRDLMRTVIDIKRADEATDGDAGARGLLERLVAGLEDVAA